MRQLIFFIFILLCINLQAQTKQYFFTHYTPRNGLLSNHTEDIVQDDKGFLWVATINGLQRFDGHWFVNFRHNAADAGSIVSDEVWDIMIDRKKNLWLLFGDGRAGIFNTSTFRFTEVPAQVSDEKIKVANKKLMEDSRGNIFLLYSFFELLTFDEKQQKFSAAHNFIIQPPGWHILDMYEHEGKYWLSCDSGLAVYNAITKNTSYKNHNADKEPAIDEYANIDRAGAIYIDSKERLWFVTWPTGIPAPFVYAYSLKENKPFITRSDIAAAWKGYSEPNHFTEQKDGRIILTGTPCVLEFSEEKKKFMRIENLLGSNLSSEYDLVQDCYSDNEQNIWLCTGNDGLYKFNPSQEVFTSIAHNNPATGLRGAGSVMSFIQLKDGSFITGTWGDGIARYNSSLEKIPLNINGITEDYNSVWCMVRKSDGKIWMGLQKAGGSIAIYDEDKNTLKQQNVLELITVRQLAEDKQGNMWIGTQSRGVYKWTAAKAINKFEDGLVKFDSIKNTLIEKLLVDSSGFLWVSTIADGLYKIDPAADKIVAHFTTGSTPAISGNSVGATFQYNDSLLLIAGGGLTIYNTRTGKTRFITTADGLPSAYIMSMLKDDAGFVWLAMLNGLCRVNIFTKAIAYFDREDGMVNDNFTLDAACRLKDGRFLFGANKDFLVFNPATIMSKSLPPDVMITEFRLSNQTLRLDSLMKLHEIELRYDNNAILIDFASLTHLQKNKITYYYMLEGVDQDWLKADNIQRATYPYLAPGSYTFKIKAANSDGVFSKNITSLKMKVSPPFWQTWWFYSLLVLVITAILFWIDRERMKRKEAVQQMRSNIADSLHKEVNTALNNINILSEMALIKADSEPEKSKEFVEQIHYKSASMITAMEDMLWSISPANDSMEKTLERMQEFIDAVNNEGNMRIEMLVDNAIKSLKLHMQLRHELLLLFKECIVSLQKANTPVHKIYLLLEKENLLCCMHFSNNDTDIQNMNNFLQRQDILKRLSSIRAALQTQAYTTHAVMECRIPVR